MTFGGNIVYLRPRSVICGPSAANPCKSPTEKRRENIFSQGGESKGMTSSPPENNCPTAEKLQKTSTVKQECQGDKGKQELHPDRSDKTSNEQTLKQNEELRKKEQELQEKEKEIEELKREKENAQQELQQQYQENKTLTARIKEFEEEIEPLKAEIKKQKEELENEKKEWEKQKEELEKQKEESEKLKEQLEKQNVESEKLKEQLEKQKEESKKQKEKLEKQNKELRNKEQELQQKEKEIEELKKEKENSQRELQQQAEENKKLTARIEELEEEIEPLKAEIKELKEESEKQKEELEKLKKELKEIKGNEHNLRLAAMCDQLQKNFYQIVFYPHDFSESKQSYKVVNIENDINAGYYGLTSKEKKRQARKRWSNLKKKLRWNYRRHLRGIKQLKYDRNPTAHPEITKHMKGGLENGAKVLKSEKKLDEPTFDIVQNLIDMWFKTEDLVQEQE